jgi:MFS transporter, FHS family, Na+ dependent glucose transporter 1
VLISVQLPKEFFVTNVIMRQTTRANLYKTFAYYGAFISIGLAAAILGPTLPGLAENTGTALSSMGFLFTARSFGYLIGATLGGRLYDRLPGHRLMGIMIAGIAVTMALTPVMNQLWLLTAVLLLMGLVESLVDIGGNTLIVWLYRDRVGPYMNALHFFFGVGAFLSPIFVAQALLHTDGITWAYWLLALLILPMALFIAPQTSPAPIATDETQPNGKRDHWLVGLIILFFFLYVGMEIGFGGWIFTYAVTLNLATETVAAYINSAFWGALTVGRLLSIPIAAYLRPRTILLLDLLGALFSISLLLIWPHSSVVVWAASIGVGLSLASIFPTTLSLAERNMPITGQTTGLFFVGASVGAMTMPWLMGVLLEKISPQAIIWFILLDIVVSIGVVAVVRLYTSRKAKASGN